VTVDPAALLFWPVLPQKAREAVSNQQSVISYTQDSVGSLLANKLAVWQWSTISDIPFVCAES
jgi:hypothetical protein